MFEDTTGVIRICNWMENRQYIYQKFEDTTGMIKMCNKIAELRTILQRESQNS